MNAIPSTEKSVQRNNFIVIDGPDGAGKTTQIFRLAEYLRSKKIEVSVTREPGGSEHAELIRDVILDPRAKRSSAAVFVQLFGAARLAHIEQTVLPLLKKGNTILCDRFEGSTYAFQIVAQNGGAGIQKFFEIQREIFRQLLPSWKTIILDVDTKIAMERLATRDEVKTHFDERKADFHKSVRNGFRTYADKFPEANCTVIDAGRSIDEVFQELLALVEKEIGL